MFNYIQLNQLKSNKLFKANNYYASNIDDMSSIGNVDDIDDMVDRCKEWLSLCSLCKQDYGLLSGNY